MGAPARALFGDRGQVGERLEDVVGVDVAEAEGTHARGVDHPAAPGIRFEAQRDGRRGGVPATAGDGVDDADGAVRVGHQGVDEGGLAHAGVADEHGVVPDQGGGDLGQRHRVVAALEDGQVEAGEVAEEHGRVGQVGLRDAEDRGDPRVVGGDQVAVDETDARLGVRRRHHDQHLVGVGDDDALDGIRVVRAAPEQGHARNDPHDAGKASLRPGRVADDVDAVAGDDRVLAQLARPGRGDPAFGRETLVEHDRVPAAVDGEDAAGQRVLVVGPGLGAGLVPLAVRAHPHAGFVELRLVVVIGARPPGHFGTTGAVPGAMRECHRSVNWGRVFAVVPMFSISTPGTTRPIRAPAVAIRWSS